MDNMDFDDDRTSRTVFRGDDWRMQPVCLCGGGDQLRSVDVLRKKETHKLAVAAQNEKHLGQTKRLEVVKIVLVGPDVLGASPGRRAKDTVEADAGNLCERPQRLFAGCVDVVGGGGSSSFIAIAIIVVDLSIRRRLCRIAPVHGQKLQPLVDALGVAVDERVVPGAVEMALVVVHCVDDVVRVLQELRDVPSAAAERVQDPHLPVRRRPASVSQLVGDELRHVLGYLLRRHAEPELLCEQDSLVVPAEEAVALRPVLPHHALELLRVVVDRVHLVLVVRVVDLVPLACRCRIVVMVLSFP